jgi:hypothetical protein
MKKIFLIIFFLISSNLFSQTPDTINKVSGPLGIWRMSNGYVYSAPGIPESTYVQDAFKFGDFWNMNDPGDEGVTFVQWINLACEQWNAERYIGVVRPPSESGVINVPSDTALYTPLWPPGMIQGAVRFSRLSKIHGQIYGINIDDFGGLDTANVHDIRDALKGKYVDSLGVVHHETPETTPWLKLFVVIYPHRTTLQPQFLPYIDGINLWYYNQNGLYTLIESDINSYRANYPGKEINFGIYVMNGDYGWMTPASISYLYHHLFDIYDDGRINGVMLFAGHWIIIPNITRTQWDNDNIPALLDTVYYPFIGRGIGHVYDSSMLPLDSVFITCFTYGRMTGDTLVRSKKRTNASGIYELSVWAGNRTTDSTQYFVVAHKTGFISDTVSGWIHRDSLTEFPDIILYNSPIGIRPTGCNVPGSFHLSQNYPNPFNPKSNIKFQIAKLADVKLFIYNVLGKEIAVLVNEQLKPGTYEVEWDASNSPSGVYFYKLIASEYTETRKMVLIK